MSEEVKKTNEIKYIACEKCKGTGRGSLGVACADCCGFGKGGFYNGKFYYWGYRFGRAVIKLRHLERVLFLVVDIGAVVFGLLGLAALSYWYLPVINSTVTTTYYDLSFWQHKSDLILIFWLSVILDMFLIYRLSVRRAGKKKIKYAKNKKEKQRIPVDWQGLRLFKRKVDVYSGFNDDAFQAVEDAYLLALKQGHGEVSGLNLFFSLLKSKEVVAFFVRLNVDGRGLVDKIRNQIAKLPKTNIHVVPIADDLKEVLIEAYILAVESRQDAVKPLHMILPLVRHNALVKEILYDMEIDEDKVVNTTEWFRINDQMVKDYHLYKKMAKYKPGSAMDRAYTAVATPILNHYSHDLTRAAKWGRLGIVVARDKELKLVFDSLTSGKYGSLLVGGHGVGKNTIIEGIARLMVEEDVPDFMKDKRLVELDIARLVSGASPAEAEERMLVMIDEIRRAGNIILYIKDLENITGISSGNEDSLDLSEVLAGAVDRGELYCLATADQDKYARQIEGAALGNVFAVINIKEPDTNQAIQILESKVGQIEAKYKVFLSYSALSGAVLLTQKCIHDKNLPQKAIDVLEAAAVKVSKKCRVDKNKCMCSQDDIAEVVSEITDIPVSKINQEESKRLLNLEESMHKRMIGQHEAVKMVADSLRRARAELREGKRPIASFLFLGPTGVGKTELAKTVAEFFFGREDLMIRVDMSEYQQADGVVKLIGGSDGARGYLTEAVRKKPFTLVLLDEIEKAHSDILNLFLQVMDDGRLTDGQGRTIDFTNSIIIATSNVGSLYIQEEIGKNVNADLDKIKDNLINNHLNQVMRPELINRFDGIVVFKPLSIKEVTEIAGLMFKKVAKQLEEKGISLEIDPGGLNKIAKEGYDPKFGARPLRRVIQDKIENRIAEKLISSAVGRRDKIIIDDDAEIIIEKADDL